MSALELARWQFAITTLYHYLFVPVTLGMSVAVALLHTAYIRTGKVVWKEQTQFWGKLFLINVAMGVVTGIVQEFQFGMNWSAYSRYVGDIFGAPLAMEGLIAFFLESTFLGVWIFGWGRLRPRVHLATIWLTAAGTWLSAAFILSANAWMQHPVGFAVNPVTHRAELHNIWAVLFNTWFLISFVHTIVAACLLAAAIFVGISCWLMARGEVGALGTVLRTGLVAMLIAGAGSAFSGHVLAQVMVQQQPMKMAAAEALWNTAKPADFSLFAVGDLVHHKNTFNLAIPHALSVLSTNTWDGKVRGINNLEKQYQQKYGPGNYEPNVFVTYWTFRIMVGIGFLMALIALIGLWLWHEGRLETSRWFHRIVLWAIALPFLSNCMGWIFTEMGRQPWVVFGLLRTQDAVSPSVSAWSVGLSLAAFTLLYGILAVITGMLMTATIRRGPGATFHDSNDGEVEALELSLSSVY